MANKTVVVQDGKLVGIAGTVDGQVLTWDATTSSASFETPGTGGTVTSVGLTGGTSGIVIGGTASPITTSGTFNLDAPLRFAWNTATPTAPTTAGQVAWNDSDGSLEVMLKGDAVLAVMGQMIYQRVYNADSVTLTKGMVVYVFGAQGNRVAVKRAQAAADSTSATILGVVAESISTGQSGFVLTSGMLRDLSVLPTSGFADGDVVYLSPSTPGGLTTTKPIAPQHLVLVGYVVKASAGSSGELLVHPQNGYELNELHDVYTSSPAGGQVLVYDDAVGQTRWENVTLSGDIASVTTAGVVTLKSVGTASTYGSASSVPVITTDAQGRVSGVVDTNIAITASAVSSIPYDLPAEIAGTPPVSTKVVNFKAVRAFTLSSTGHQGGQIGNPSSDVVCTVRKGATSLGTITFTSSGFGHSIAQTSFAIGEVLSVETPSAVNGIDTPYFTLAMTLG